MYFMKIYNTKKTYRDLCALERLLKQKENRMWRKRYNYLFNVDFVVKSLNYYTSKCNRCKGFSNC